MDISIISYELFKAIMARDSLTDQDWEAARLAIHGTFQDGDLVTSSGLGELAEVLKFLDYHIGLRAAGEIYESSVIFAMEAIIIRSENYRANALTVESIKNFNQNTPYFANGVRSMMNPDNTFDLRLATTGLMALTSEQWFDSPVPAEEMSEFCEHLAVYIIDEALHGDFVQRCGAIILFEMLRSPEWREHIATRYWSMFAYSTRVVEERESFKWCLQNAIELLEFTRGLPHGQGLKWWYGTLWFHYDKLDTTVRDEVEKIAREMSLGDGLSDLNLYLNLIGQEVARTRQEVEDIPNQSRPAGFGVELRARLIALERITHRLTRITGAL